MRRVRETDRGMVMTDKNELLDGYTCCDHYSDELSRAHEFLRLHGYRRCDISACNCGSWHGGHEHQRLIEIREAFEQDEHTDTRNKTLLNLVCEVLEDRASLKLRAERAEYALVDCVARTINECQDVIERWTWHGARNATELETEAWYKARLSAALEGMTPNADVTGLAPRKDER